MRKETKEKLNLLAKVGKINDADLKILLKLDHDLSIYDEGEKEEMLLIHVAMALNRQHAKQKLEKMPNDLWYQIKEKNKFDKAFNYWKRIEQDFSINLNAAENEYILMHLVNVISSNKEVTKHD